MLRHNRSNSHPMSCKCLCSLIHDFLVVSSPAHESITNCPALLKLVPASLIPLKLSEPDRTVRLSPGISSLVSATSLLMESSLPASSYYSIIGTLQIYLHICEIHIEEKHTRYIAPFRTLITDVASSASSNGLKETDGSTIPSSVRNAASGNI